MTDSSASDKPSVDPVDKAKLATVPVDMFDKRTIDPVDKQFAKMRNLVQYKKISDEVLYVMAQGKVSAVKQVVAEPPEAAKNEDEVEVEGMFVNAGEKKEARVLLNKYLGNYTFENISEKNTVKQLVFLEVFNTRLQVELNQYHEEGQPSPPKTIESLHSNLNQISMLKAQLGIRKDKEKTFQSDAYLTLETLKRKFKKWREENSGSRTLICPHCGKMVMLKIRTDAWEAQKHPFFIDRFIANKHMMKMWSDGKISKDDVAKVLETSVDYVQWLLEKVFPKSFRKIEVKEEINGK